MQCCTKQIFKLKRLCILMAASVIFISIILLSVENKKSELHNYAIIHHTTHRMFNRITSVLRKIYSTQDETYPLRTKSFGINHVSPVTLTKPKENILYSLLRMNQQIKHNKKRTILKKSNLEENHNMTFLSAVINVRIYAEDKAKLTTTELKQWMEYMIYAGVEKIYVYDCYKFLNESLANWCQTSCPETVVYHDWGLRYPYSLQNTKLTAYQHAIDHYKKETKWQTAFDMDEYPFVPNDTNRGFLKRFLFRMEDKYPKVSELSLKNFLFIGKPKQSGHMVTRYLRRTPGPANRLDKPIYIIQDVKVARCHHNGLFPGKRSLDIDPKEIRTNHYWGGRLQNWGDDTPEILNTTIIDDSILEIVHKIEKTNV